jgi:hypothetical protein
MVSSSWFELGSSFAQTLQAVGSPRVTRDRVQGSANLTAIPPFAGLTDLTYDLALSGLGISTISGFPNLEAVPNLLRLAVPPPRRRHSMWFYVRHECLALTH